MEFTSDSAKQFLLSKLSEQAMHDGVVLDETEKRMFLFSESSGGTDLEAQQQFDADYDSKTYEAKITKLLRRSYARDKQTGDEKSYWKPALKVLAKEDFYGLVMVDQAKIPRVDAGLWLFLLGMLPFALVELVVVSIGFIAVFQPSAVRMRLPGWFRLLLLPFFSWLFWYVGKIFERIQFARSVKRNEPQQR